MSSYEKYVAYLEERINKAKTIESKSAYVISLSMFKKLYHNIK